MEAHEKAPEIPGSKKFSATAPSTMMTPLHYAAIRDHNDVVELLIEKGANVDAKAFVKTALHFACEKDFLKIAMTLLKYGANIEVADENGFTPLHIASYKGHETLVSIEKSLILFYTRIRL